MRWFHTVGFLMLTTQLVAAERSDYLGQPLPDRAIARCGLAHFRSTHYPTAVVFSADGKRLIIASGPMFYICDVQPQRVVRSFTIEFRTPATHLELSPDGKHLIAIEEEQGSPRRAHLIDVEDGTIVEGFDKGERKAATFSPDGKTLATFSGGNDNWDIILWDFTDGKQRFKLSGAMSDYGWLKFTPEGRTLRTAAQRGYQWVDLEKKRVTRQWRAGYVEDQIAARDAIGVASVDQLVFRVAREEILKKNPKVKIVGEFLCFSKGGDLFATAELYTHVVRIYDSKSGEELRRLQSSEQVQGAAEFSPDGKWLATAQVHRVVLWNLDKQAPLPVWDTSAISALAFSHDGTIYSGSWGGPARAWDAKTGKWQRKFTDGRGGPIYLALSADGKSLATSNAEGLQFWNTADGVKLKFHAKTTPSVIEHSGADRFVTVDSGGRVTAVDLANKRADKHFDTGTFYFRLSPDGKTLATFDAIAYPSIMNNPEPHYAPNDLLRLWDVAEGKQVWASRDEPKKRKLEASHPLLFLGSDATGACYGFSPDSRLLAWSKNNERLFVLDVATKQTVAWFPLEPNDMGGSFSPDGRTYAMRTRHSGVRLIEVASGATRDDFDGTQGAVTTIAWSRDGRLMATGGEDTTILIWQVLPHNVDGPLTKSEWEKTWESLREPNGRAAYRAIQRLAYTPKLTLRLSGERIAAFKTEDTTRQVEGWIANLDDLEYRTREKAAKELRRAGPSALPRLREEAKKTLSAEARTRVDRLVQELEAAGPTPTPDRLRLTRALEAVELIGTNEAAILLDQLGQRAADESVRREATASAERLRSRLSR